MTTPARLRLPRLLFALALPALGVACASADEAVLRKDVQADAEMDEGEAADDEDAAFESEQAPAPPPGADAMVAEEGGESDDAGAAEPSARRRAGAPESSPADRAEAEREGGGGLLGLLSVFGSDDEPAPEPEASPKKKEAASGTAGPPARRAPPYPWVSTRAASRVVIQPTPRTGSWGLSTALMQQQVRPLPERVRPQDFINAPDYGYPAAQGPSWGRVEVDLAPSPTGAELLRVGLVTSAAATKPVDITLVVDATKRTPTEALDVWRDLATRACEVLRPDDRLSVVTVTDTIDQAIHVEHAAPFAAVPPYPEGTAMLDLGLAAALRAMAVTARDAHRVLVVFAATTPVNEMTQLRQRVQLLRQQGVHVSFVSSVSARQPDADLLSLARDGGGQHIFVDEQQAVAPRAQVRALAASLSPAFVDADLVFRFDGEAVQSYRLIGYQRRGRGGGDHVTVALGREQEVTFLFEISRRGAGAHDGATLGTLGLRSPSNPGRPLPLIARAHVTLEAAPTSMKRAVVAASVAEWLRDAEPLVSGRERWLALAGDDADLAPVLDVAKAFLP